MFRVLGEVLKVRVYRNRTGFKSGVLGSAGLGAVFRWLFEKKGSRFLPLQASGPEP